VFCLLVAGLQLGITYCSLLQSDGGAGRFLLPTTVAAAVSKRVGVTIRASLLYSGSQSLCYTEMAVECSGPPVFAPQHELASFSPDAMPSFLGSLLLRKMQAYFFQTAITVKIFSRISFVL
jgi:hypothetical protein